LILYKIKKKNELIRAVDAEYANYMSAKVFANIKLLMLEWDFFDEKDVNH
jgi:hypothetical protein